MKELKNPAECFDRLKALTAHPPPKAQHAKLRRASVLVLLDDQMNTLITKRSMDLRSHPGECCFPGGRQDEDEAGDDVRTALREAQEEVGLDPSHVQVLGRLPTLESVNRLCVTPILGKLQKARERCSWILNPAEVDAAFWLPLAFFLSEPESKFDVEWSGEIFTMRSYVYDDVVEGKSFAITGLTAHIAHEAAMVAYVNYPAPASNPAQSATIRSIATPSSSSSSNGSNSNQGYLWRRQESSRGRAYWTRRFFVIADQMLHQYDNADQAQRKTNSANKKNRLPLQDLEIHLVTHKHIMSASPSGGGGSSSSSIQKFEFTVQALEGKVHWHLASEAASKREEWISRLQQQKITDSC